MDKSEALKRFYQKNDINIYAATDELNAGYDRRIAGLSAQVDIWLSNIDSEDQELFLTLLSRYHYLTEVCCQRRYCRILDMLERQLQNVCGLAEALFVTVESSSGFKAGSDNVRADLYRRSFPKIQKDQILAAQSRLKESELGRYRAIVFLDDIVGSGMTLWSSMKSFCDRFHTAACAEEGPLLYYSCIAPRRDGIEHIKRNCEKYKIRALPLIDEDWYEEPALDKLSADYQRLKRYEKMVDSYLKDPNKSFFMGFGQNRLLVSFYYNTPNNTLCTFWRETPYNAPPFRRDGNQPARPTVAMLQACTDKLQANAYAFGMDRREKRKNE